MAGTVAQLSGMIRSKDEEKIAILEEIRKFDDHVRTGHSHSIQFMITDVVFSDSTVSLDGNKYTFSLSYLEYSCTSKKLHEIVSISYSTEPQIAAEVKIICYVDSDEGIEKNVYIVCRFSSDLHKEFSSSVSSITLEAKSDADGSVCNLVASGKIIEFKQQLSELQEKLQAVEVELDELKRKLRDSSAAPTSVPTRSPKKSTKKSKKSMNSQDKPAQSTNTLVKSLTSYTLKSCFFIYEYRAVALFGLSSVLIYSYGDYISV